MSLNIELSVDRLMAHLDLIQFRTHTVEFGKVGIKFQVDVVRLAVEPCDGVRDGLACRVEIELQLSDVETDVEIEFINLLSTFCHPIPSLHHIVNKAFTLLLFAQCRYNKLIEQEANLVCVNFLHRPPIGGL